MPPKKKAKQLLLFSIVFICVVGSFYWIVSKDWQQTRYTFESVNRAASTDEILAGDTLEQSLTVQMQYINDIALDLSCWGNRSDRQLRLVITREGQAVWQSALAYDDIQVDALTFFPIDPPLAMNGQPITLQLSAEGGISAWYGNTRSAGRFVVAVDGEEPLVLNGASLAGQLVLQVNGYNELRVLNYFWYAAGVLYLLGIGLLLVTWTYPRSLFNIAAAVFKRYRYLLKQMISRDFRVKYRASFLGVLWSFLNPLMMTFVYYFVFSMIFKNSIENFIVYLMSGIILFNYFSETTSVALISIVSNANLINKIYIPKYIFPLSKALSSSINLLVSFIPLFLLMIVTGVPFHRSLLLIPMLAIFLISFTAGVCLILSSMDVFFRDVQFLWSVIISMWNFFTPIFYPETIIPLRYQTLYHMNPLYQICAFSRTIILSGTAPTPRNLLMCLLVSFGTLAVGLCVFRKTQDRFVLYL